MNRNQQECSKRCLMLKNESIMLEGKIVRAPVRLADSNGVPGVSFFISSDLSGRSNNSRNLHVSAHGREAVEALLNFGKIGRNISVSGISAPETFRDRHGVKHTRTFIRADHIRFLSISPERQASGYAVRER